MADMIDSSAGRDAIAYIGETPWHGKGQRLTIGADLDTWTREAGLAYEVKSSPVRYDVTEIAPEQASAEFAGRRVLYRSDTGKPLGIVSDGYKAVQPSTVMGFFRELAASNHFHMETAGALDGGRRVWALARCSEGAPVIGHDVVRPYVLLATSYDGSMATTAKFTSIRVVCHNTLTMSAGYAQGAGQGRGQSETDSTEGAVVQCIRVPHSIDFDPRDARMQLGIALDAFDRFLIESRRLAETRVDDAFVVEFLKRLLPRDKAHPERDPEQGRTFKRLLSIWKGETPSATLPEAKGTAWGLLNAITWDVDHLRGADETRLRSAWFGSGEGLKNKARDLLVEVTA